MNPSRSRREAAVTMLTVSAARMLEYAERHRQVIALADLYGVEETLIAEITELDIAEVRRILAQPTEL